MNTVTIDGLAPSAERRDRSILQEEGRQRSSKNANKVRRPAASTTLVFASTASIKNARVRQ